MSTTYEIGSHGAEAAGFAQQLLVMYKSACIRLVLLEGPNSDGDISRNRKPQALCLVGYSELGPLMLERAHPFNTP